MNPKQALELAAQNYTLANLPSAIASTSVYKGTENIVNVDSNTSDAPQTKVLPCVILEADGEHTQIGLKTGCWRGSLSVSVQADAERTTDAGFDALCGPVFDLFDADNAADQLSAHLTKFTAIFASARAQGMAVKNGKIWENSIRLDVVYAQADL